MDIALQNILINTYSSHHQQRHQAEEALEQFLSTPNFLPAFFILIEENIKLFFNTDLNSSIGVPGLI
jgi:hypothetical protein